MRIRTFFYVIKQGIKSTFKNKWFTLASVATIGACLFLFGIGYSIVMNLQYMVKAAEEGVDYTATIIATKGRASYLGERSIGHQDPGATSATYTMQAVRDFIKG